MSNIIKGGRIRSEGILNLSNRIFQVQEEPTSEKEQIIENKINAIDEEIHQKQQELQQLEYLIQQRIEEARQKAEEVVSDACEKGRQIEEEARKKASLIIEQAAQKQEEILENVKQEADRIREQALAEKENKLQAVEGEVVELIIKIIQHIISEELIHNTDWLKYLVRKMMSEGMPNEEVTLLVSSENMARLREEETFASSLLKLAAVEADDALNDTTLVLVTSRGNIEYDISRGMEQVISELRIINSLS